MVEKSASRRGGQNPSGVALDFGDSDDQFVVRALSRGLRVLTLFSIDHPRWTLAELARTTGLHKATTYRMTRTM